jgi:hypothetical protein
MQSPCNPFIKYYTEIIYMIGKGNVQSIQFKMNFAGPKSMSKVDDLSLSLIYFYVPAFTLHLNSRDLAAAS